MRIIVLLLVVSIECISQPQSYFVTSSGEKVDCYIDPFSRKRNLQNLSYRFNKSDDPKSIQLSQLREVYLDKKKSYIVATVKIDNSSNRISALKAERAKSPGAKFVFEKKTLLLKPLVTGRANLYSSYSEGITKLFFNVDEDTIGQLLYKRYFLGRHAFYVGPDYAAENKKYQQQLLKYVNCDPRRKVEDLPEFEKFALINYFEDYNEQCKAFVELSTEEKKKLESKTRLAPGLIIGLNSSVANLRSDIIDNYFLDADFVRENSIMGGPSLRISFPHKSKQLAITTSILYLSANYMSRSSIQRSPYFEETEVSIKLTQLKIPIGLTYLFSDNSLSPYGSFGVSNTIHLNTSSSRMSERTFDDGFELIEEEVIDFSSNHFAFWFGLGLMKTISPKMSVFGEGRFEYTTGITKSNQLSSIKSNLINFQFLVGVAF